MKRVVEIVGTFLLMIAFSFQSEAQKGKSILKKGHGQFIYHTVVLGRDTIPFTVLPTVQIFAKAPRKLRKAAKKWNRLRNAVFFTYPFAHIVANQLENIKKHAQKFHSRRARKKYLKLAEQEIMVSFGPQMDDLSVYDGKILIKLIDKDTGYSCYQLLKKFKGGLAARLFQTAIAVFGENLKSSYSKQKDPAIAAIVQEIKTNPYYYKSYYRRHYME